MVRVLWTLIYNLILFYAEESIPVLSDITDDIILDVNNLFSDDMYNALPKMFIEDDDPEWRELDYTLKVSFSWFNKGNFVF